MEKNGTIFHENREDGTVRGGKAGRRICEEGSYGRVIPNKRNRSRIIPYVRTCIRT